MIDSQIPFDSDYFADPKLIVVVGRRASGKTFWVCQLMARWAPADEGAPRVMALDAVTPDPQSPDYMAGWADVWSATPVGPDEIPPSVELVAVDEADMWASQSHSRRLVDGERLPVVDLVFRGRHRRPGADHGITLVLATQRPAELMRSAWALADAVVICQTTDPADLARLERLGPRMDGLSRIIASSGRPGPVVIWQPPPRPVLVFGPDRQLAREIHSELVE